jgi:glutathione peroxidase
MKTTIIASLLMMFLVNPSGIYSFKLNTVDGEGQINFSDYKGKKILIVNTACKSPYTFQFTGMQQLYNAYKEKLVVIAIPAGDAFGDQEFKTNSEIRDFCRYSYGITFPVAEKVVLNGSLRHPLIQFLLDEAKKLGMEEPVIKGNFTKFLLDENGSLVKVFPADVQPMSMDITAILDNDNSWKL